jgi:polar amino acid transport system substrate-binding protein
MIIYFVLTFSLSKVLNHYERKMKHDAWRNDCDW